MRFPQGNYGRQKLEFLPAPFRAPFRAFAALVFPWDGDRVLICNIEDRGWCIPSGRVEPDETSLDAAVREAREEAGAVLTDMVYLGCYRITTPDETRYADLFTGVVHELHEIPDGFESTGRQYRTIADLPEVYHLWNPLTEALFAHAYERIRRHLDAVSRFD